MKQFLFFALLAGATAVFADDAKNEWHNTTLSDETIKQIQQAQIKYKQCVAEEMQKTGYAKIDSRNATNAIIKQCEPTLTQMREVYLKADVPKVVADRHLRSMRIKISRKVLQQLMFAEAARAAGQIKP